MGFEEDFADEKPIDLELKNKPGFLYKRTTAGDETEWLNDYMEYDEKEQKNKQNLTKLNKCKLRNLVGVPYGAELIDKIIGINKEWNQLNNDQRWILLSKMKASVLTDIIIAMNKADSGDDASKKD